MEADEDKAHCVYMGMHIKTRNIDPNTQRETNKSTRRLNMRGSRLSSKRQRGRENRVRPEKQNPHA